MVPKLTALINTREYWNYKTTINLIRKGLGTQPCIYNSAKSRENPRGAKDRQGLSNPLCLKVFAEIPFREF